MMEFMSLLNEAQPHWNIDVLELCGGEARVAYLSVKRHRIAGQCFYIEEACG